MGDACGEVGLARDLAARAPSLAEGLWAEVQRRRASLRGSPYAAPPAWCGSIQDLQALLVGSVILDVDDEAEFVPPSTDALPAVKFASGGLLVRVARDAEGATGRYTSLLTLVSTSSRIWPGVLASKGGDGAMAATCRAAGKDVALRVAGRTGGRLAFQMLERSDGFKVMLETVDVAEIGRALEEGPALLTWREFQGSGPWGDAGLGLADGQVSGVRVPFEKWEEARGALGLGSTGASDCGVEVMLALVAAVVGLPGPLACARELSWVWEATRGEEVAALRESVLGYAHKAVELVLSKAGDVMPFLADEARSLAALEVATRVGGVLRGQFMRPWLDFSPFHPVRVAARRGGGSVVSSPVRRGSRSATAAGRSVSILAAAPSAAASAAPSPRSSPKRRQRDWTVDELAQLTPTSLLEAAKRMCVEKGRRGGASQASAERTRQQGMRQPSCVDERAASSEPSAIPFPSLASAATPQQRGGGESGVGGEGAGASAGASSKSARGTVAAEFSGTTMWQADAGCAGNLRPYFPEECGGVDVVEWVACLAETGFPAAPTHFMHASGAAGVGVAPDAGGVLEAELMVSQVSVVVEDLRARDALPSRLCGQERPQDWREAARNARALLNAYLSVFRARKSEVAGVEGHAAVAAQSGDKVKEKPPTDSYETVEIASKAAEKQLALPADMLQGVTSVQVLRREHLRASAFKDIATATHDERERQLNGEIRYLVEQYGQGAAAYLTSNGMSTGKVRGYGVPTALAGVRGHLERRAQAWVESVFGRERAADAQYASEAQRLKLSIMSGVVTGDGTEAAELVIVRLLGGSKPNEVADIRREGGGITEGTLGSLSGEAAHFSVRTAYQLWAQGLARCMGRVLVAVQTTEDDADDVLGEARDFDIQENLIKIPHTLPIAGLRSTCRHFPRKVAFAMQAFRGLPGTPAPDLRAMAAEMGGPVLEKRLQDAEYARTSEDHFERMRSGLEDRVRVLEGRLARAKTTAAVPAVATSAGARPARPGGAPSRWSRRSLDSARALPGGVPTPAASLLAEWRPRQGAVEQAGPREADGRVAKPGGVPRDAGRITSKMQAVSQLQKAVRSRLGLDPGRNHGKAEPCSWAAILGSCTKKGCECCAGKLRVPEDVLQSVRDKCAEGVLRVKQPKEPG